MADDGDDGFITLPPGIFDTSTLKAMPKPERPRTEADDIVFVPVTPGMPVPPVEAVPPAVDTATEATSAPAAASVAPSVAPAAAPLAAAPHVQSPSPTARAATSWTLVLADGSEVPVHGVLLLGRNPAPFPEWPSAHLLAVADSTQSVSKTHAAFEVDDSGLWVHDLGSTNGVWVVRGDDVTEVSPGRRVNVRTGSTIELGDYMLGVRG
ncbi:MAG: FHA domain-containing protein [Protaetiibacter sp.]